MIIQTKTSTLNLANNQNIYIKLPKLDNDKHIVYLMYRKCFGFRIGITNKIKDKENSFGARTHSENADKLWIIKIVDSKEEAIFQEEYFSLKFGIPTCVFNGENRGLNQERINRIFKEFGQSGFNLLKHLNYSFKYAHYIAPSSSCRNVINFIISENDQLISLEWKFKDDINSYLDNLNINYTLGKNYRLRKKSSSFQNSINFLNQFNDDFMIKEKLSKSISNKFLVQPIPTISLFKGFYIFRKDNNDFIEEEIIDIQNSDDRALY